MSFAGADAYQAFWAVTFWVCAALLVYVYLGYPALAWARAALARPRGDRDRATPGRERDRRRAQ